MYYLIKQTEKKYFISFLSLWEYKKEFKYKFKKLSDAMRFALEEQIKIIFCIVDEEKNIVTTLRPFYIYLTLKEFKRFAKKNPVFYLGVSDHKRVNIDLYYYILINRNMLNKLTVPRYKGCKKESYTNN